MRKWRRILHHGFRTRSLVFTHSPKDKTHWFGRWNHLQKPFLILLRVALTPAIKAFPFCTLGSFAVPLPHLCINFSPGVLYEPHPRTHTHCLPLKISLVYLPLSILETISFKDIKIWYAVNYAHLPGGIHPEDRHSDFQEPCHIKHNPIFNISSHAPSTCTLCSSHT